jgi:two-component system OmpR family response regulator
VAYPRILLIDDDRALTDVLSMSLEDAGFTVACAHDGLAGWRAFEGDPPDLVVLDLVMPELDGLELCRRIRAGHRTPIIMLTSRDEELDRVLGLELGADDYVTKPFSTRELVARIRAALRRVDMERKPVEESSMRRGALRLDRDRRRVWLREAEVTLTATEFDLLWTLASRPGHVLPRQELIDRVYGEGIVVADRTIDTFIKRLRRKLADSAHAIETVRGVGYRFGE